MSAEGSRVVNSLHSLQTNIGRLGIISVRNPDFAAALVIYLPANIHPIHINGSKSTFYLFYLPHQDQIDLTCAHMPFLSAGNDNGRFWIGGGCDILLRTIFVPADYDQIIASAPQLTTAQYKALREIFSASQGEANDSGHNNPNSA